MIDDTKARGLQQLYQGGAPHALNALAEECQAIAFYIVKSRVRRMGIQYTRSAMEDAAHDASARLIQRYLTTPGYTVRSFPKILRLEVNHVLSDGGHSNRPGVVARRDAVQIDDLELQCSSSEVIDDVRDFLRDLRTEHTMGDQIVLDIYRASSFRDAVMKLSEYVERRWIYDRAKKIRTVYKMTRRVRDASRHMR